MKHVGLLNSVALLIILSFFSFGFHLNPTLDQEENLIDKAQNYIFKDYDNHSIEIRSNEKGEVTIKGTVNTLYDKLWLYEKASEVKGVKKIKDLLEIETDPVPDAIVKQNIEEELHLNSKILEPDRIKVAVDNGEVILNGVVSFKKEREMAEAAASWQKGVLGITNNIKVLPHNEEVSDNNLDIILKEILKNQLGPEKNVKLNVNKGVVTLNGTASGPWAKRNIMKDFLQVPGVDFIKNNLHIAKNSL